MLKQLLLLLILTFNLQAEENPSMKPTSTTTTIYLFRTAEKTTSQQNANEDLKQWITDQNAPLTEKGRKQAKEIRPWIKHIAFDQVISSEAVAAKTTAKLALPKHKIDLIDNAWREVDLGDLEGKTPEVVKKMYAEYHPTLPLQEDGNECLNAAWPEVAGKPKINFEPYNEFKERIQSNIRKIDELYQGQVIAIFTHYEPIRDGIMYSKGTEAFFSTEFGAKISQLMAGNPTQHEIGTALKRTMIKADKAAGIKLTVTNGEILLDDTFKIIIKE